MVGILGAGSLLTRGLGSSGLLVTRGLSEPFSAFIEVLIERPRQLRTAGAGGRTSRHDYDYDRRVGYFVGVRLIIINGQELLEPIEGSIKVTYGRDNFRVASALPRVKRRLSSLMIRARLVRPKGQ